MSDWLLHSLLAAAFWGLSYALAERVLGTVGVFAYLAGSYLLELVAVTLVGLRLGKLRIDLQTATPGTLGLVALTAALQLAGNYCVSVSIQQKNASLASAVEASYPLFTMAFSCLLFRQSTLTASTMAGAVLVMLGVGLISHG